MIFDKDQLFYRFYPKHLEIDKTSTAHGLSKQSHYVLSISDETQQLAQIESWVKLIPLGDKLLISACSLSFYYGMSSRSVVVKLSRYFGDRLAQIAEGELQMSQFIKNYQQNQQRYYPEFKVVLNFTTGPMKMVFEAYLEKSLYELDIYVRQLKQQQQLKRTRKLRGEQAQRKSSIKANQIIIQHSSQNDDKMVEQEDFEQNQDVFKTFASGGKSKSLHSSDIRNSTHNETSYLELNSAFQTTNQFKKLSNQESSSGAGLVSKQSLLLPYVIEMGMSANLGNFNEKQMQKSSISDGSQYSQMVQKQQNQSYSSKAVRSFYSKLRKFNTILMVLVAIFVIYMVLMPHTNYQKIGAKPKSKHKRREVHRR